MEFIPGSDARVTSTPADTFRLLLPYLTPTTHEEGSLFRIVRDDAIQQTDKVSLPWVRNTGQPKDSEFCMTTFRTLPTKKHENLEIIRTSYHLEEAKGVALVSYD